MPSNDAITIVIPVYADWTSLKNCLLAIEKTVDLSRDKVLLINDNGPDADELEKNIKKVINKKPGFEYHRNSKNLGFVGTCNRAVNDLDKGGNDILLLNSDTQPTDGWIDEMRSVLGLSDSHGVVTPRSNNATLATVPLSAAPQKGIEAEKSFIIFQKMRTKLPRYYVAPVGHGFCMLIRRRLIDEFGLFDPAFGKGYGEEVDFCQRIKKHGFLCLIANRAYVFHLEARSFTHSTKAKLLEKNNQIIWQRYPDYRKSVQKYMSETVEQESKIEQSLGLAPKRNQLKRLIRKNSAVHRLAKKTLRR